MQGQRYGLLSIILLERDIRSIYVYDFDRSNYSRPKATEEFAPNKRH